LGQGLRFVQEYFLVACSLADIIRRFRRSNTDWSTLPDPNTINTMPEETLLAFSEHGRVDGVIPRNGGDCDQVLAEFGRVGIDLAKVGADLQKQGAESFDDSWRDLLKALEMKSKALK
jgi:transaldolase